MVVDRKPRRNRPVDRVDRLRRSPHIALPLSRLNHFLEMLQSLITKTTIRLDYECNKCCSRFSSHVIVVAVLLGSSLDSEDEKNGTYGTVEAACKEAACNKKLHIMNCFSDLEETRTCEGAQARRTVQSTQQLA